MQQNHQTLLALTAGLLSLPSSVSANQPDQLYYFYNSKNTTRYQISSFGDCFKKNTNTIFNNVLNKCTGYAITNAPAGDFESLYGDSGCDSPGGPRGFISFSRHVADFIDAVFEQCSKDTMHDDMYDDVSSTTKYIVAFSTVGGILLLCALFFLYKCYENRRENAAQNLNAPILNQNQNYQSDADTNIHALQIQDAEQERPALN